MERLRPRPSRTCPLCREQLEAEALELRSCDGCQTTYHGLCLDELGGCSTLGCSRKGVGGEADGEFSIPPGRLARIRAEVARENKRWAQLAQRPEGIEVDRSDGRLRIVLHPDAEEARSLKRAAVVMVLMAVGVLLGGIFASLEMAWLGCPFFLLLAYVMMAGGINRTTYDVDEHTLRGRTGPLLSLRRPFSIPREDVRKVIVNYKTVQVQEQYHQQLGQLVVLYRVRGEPMSKVLLMGERPSRLVFLRDTLSDGLDLDADDEDEA